AADRLAVELRLPTVVDADADGRGSDRVLDRPESAGAERMSLLRLAGLIALSLGLIGQAGPAAAQTADRPWRETLQLDAPLLAAKRWENARGFIEQGSWEAALEALAELEADFPNELVKVAPGQYLSLPLAVRLMRLHLPTEGLALYRQQLDGWAEQQLESARR